MRPILIHHRSLNHRAKLERAFGYEERLPGYRHAHEADICWAEGPDGEMLLYAFHPHAILDRPNWDKAQQMIADGELWSIETALEAASGRMVVLELKLGHGPARKALEKLERLCADYPGEVVIDGFSLKLLKLMRDVAPERRMSIHTGMFGAKRTRITAVEWPPFRNAKTAELPVQIIALRWYGARASMERQLSAARAAGFGAHMSRLRKPGRLLAALEMGLDAIYIDPLEVEAHEEALNRFGA